MSRHLKKSVYYALIAAFLFASLGVLTKIATEEFPVPMATFFRQVFSLAFLSPFLAYRLSQRREVSVLRTGRVWLHLLRAVISMSSMYCLFFAIKMLPLADAILLGYTRPLFLPILVWLVMGKRIERTVWIGLAVGFVGVASILKPDAAVMEVGTIIGLGSGLLGAAAILCIRRLGKTEPPSRIMFYYFAFSIVMSAIPAALTWERPDGPYVGIMVAIGGAGALYQAFLTLAYRYGRATIVSSVLYSAVVFTLAYDFILWRELPDLWSIAGIILICSGAILVISMGRARAAPAEQPMGKTRLKSD